VKVSDHIEIERQSLRIEQESDTLWRLSIDGTVYIVSYYDNTYSIAEERVEKVYGYGGEELLESYIYIADLDNGYQVAKYFIDHIL
jgi:hypothetical protein